MGLAHFKGGSKEAKKFVYCCWQIMDYEWLICSSFFGNKCKKDRKIKPLKYGHGTIFRKETSTYRYLPKNSHRCFQHKMSVWSFWLTSSQLSLSHQRGFKKKNVKLKTCEKYLNFSKWESRKKIIFCSVLSLYKKPEKHEQDESPPQSVAAVRGLVWRDSLSFWGLMMPHEQLYRKVLFWGTFLFYELCQVINSTGYLCFQLMHQWYCNRQTSSFKILCFLFLNQWIPIRHTERGIVGKRIVRLSKSWPPLPILRVKNVQCPPWKPN